MTEEEAKKYHFHGWRHFYVTWLKKVLPGNLVKDQTGHGTEAMLNHYGNHRTAEDELLIRDALKKTFQPLKLLSTLESGNLT
jgi:integrase